MKRLQVICLVVATMLGFSNVYARSATYGYTMSGVQVASVQMPITAVQLQKNEVSLPVYLPMNTFSNVVLEAKSAATAVQVELNPSMGTQYGATPMYSTSIARQVGSGASTASSALASTLSGSGMASRNTGFVSANSYLATANAAPRRIVGARSSASTFGFSGPPTGGLVPDLENQEDKDAIAPMGDALWFVLLLGVAYAFICRQRKKLSYAEVM